MNVRTILTWATKQLKKTQSPALDAEVLLSFVLKKPKEFLHAHPSRKLTQLQTTNYRLLINKRANHWPIAYLTGHKEFFGLDFLVTKDVLIPRPETELLVELALERLKIQNLRFKNVIDVGTGSGNVTVSLTKTLLFERSREPDKKNNFSTGSKIIFFATDSSAKALQVARSNARRHGIAGKIKFLHGHLLSPLKSKILNLKSALILANLPYLTLRQYRSNPDLKREPKAALVGGKDGMKYFRELLEQLHSFLPSPGPGRVAARLLLESAPRSRRPARQGGRERSQFPFDSAQGQNGITLLIEHDPAQKNKLEKLILQYFPQAKVKFYRDLSGRWRVCSLNLEI